MRGTNNKQAFDTFADGTKCVPIVSDERFNKAVGLFKKASSLDPNYGRPKGWLAYTYVLHLQEGWTFDPAQHPEEAAWSKDPSLLGQKAEELAEAAKALDESDYDLWWALGVVQLHTKSPSGAIASYETALELNKDENNPHLLVEMADALLLAGDHDRALTLCRRARRIRDWHRHQMAFCYYVKARKTPKPSGSGDAPTIPLFYDLCLDELRWPLLGTGRGRLRLDHPIACRRRPRPKGRRLEARRQARRERARAGQRRSGRSPCSRAHTGVRQLLPGRREKARALRRPGRHGPLGRGLLPCRVELAAG